MPDDAAQAQPQPGSRPRGQRYWGLRPRRSIRRGSLVVLAIALFGVLLAEAVWMLGHDAAAASRAEAPR